MGTVGEWLGNGRGMSQGVAGAAIERPQRGERRIGVPIAARGEASPPVTSKNEAGELPNWTVATSESKNKEEELPSRAVQKEAVA